MNNPVQWFEIATTDLERAKNFYASVFGLEFQFVDMPDNKMYMFGAPDRIGSSGCLVQSAENTPSAAGTVIYFACEDVTNEAAKVESAGGKLIVPKTDIGEFGFFAQCIDTEGNRIGMHSQQQCLYTESTLNRNKKSCPMVIFVPRHFGASLLITAGVAKQCFSKLLKQNMSPVKPFGWNNRKAFR